MCQIFFILFFPAARDTESSEMQRQPQNGPRAERGTMMRKSTKRWTKHYKTTIKGAELKINFCMRKETGVTSLRGYLVDAKSGIRHDACVEVHSVAKNEAEIAPLAKAMIVRAGKKYEAKCADAGKKTYGGLTSVLATLAAEELALLYPPQAQAESSRKQSLSYFRRLCEELDKKGIVARQENADEIASFIREATKKNKKALQNRTTENTIYRHLTDVEWQLDQLASIRPDAGIGPLLFPRKRAQGVAPEVEQRKYIGLQATILTITALQKAVENGLSLGGIFMLEGMARTAEACAPRFGEIHLGDNYAVIPIVWQADGTVRVEDLKTDDSYRLVVLPRLAAEAIRARMAYLRSQGYTEKQIWEMPAVSSERDPTTQARPAALSAFLLQILTKHLNLDDVYWDSLKTQMAEEPDMDANGMPTTDITAYIARRSRCTELCNGCGINPLLVDAMMGHAPPRSSSENWADYLRRPDSWPIIAHMLERVVHDPECTTNPAFAEIALSPGKAGKDTCPSIAYTFRAEASCTVEIIVHTSEECDNIEVETEGEIVEKQCIVASFENTHPLPALAKVYPRDYYERLRSEAKTLTDTFILEQGGEDSDGKPQDHTYDR